MEKESKDIRQYIDNVLDIHLNGDWSQFQDTVDKLRNEIGQLSKSKQKALKKALNKKIDLFLQKD